MAFENFYADDQWLVVRIEGLIKGYMSALNEF